MSAAAVEHTAAPVAGAGDVVLQAENLARYYKVRIGVLAGSVLLKAVDGASFVIRHPPQPAFPRPLRCRPSFPASPEDTSRYCGY